MLELKNICFEINGKKILNNINLCIEDKSLIAFTGPNGSGKSTLMKIIMGIETPTTGEVYWNGRNITKLSIDERAKLGIAFAFQSPISFKGLTVADMLSLATGKKLNFCEVCDCLASVGLCAKDYANREIDGALSGGESKRIEIASVLARKWQCVIFDEPEAGIDLWSFGKLIEVFKDLHTNNNGIMLIVSHQEKLLDIADKIIILGNGEITKIGDKGDLLGQVFGVQRECKKGIGEENNG